MDFIFWLIDLVMHLDKHLSYIIQTYGAWSYLILFLIIFCETGLVVTPFLPGDSLVFVIGTFAARGDFNLIIITLMLMIAAISGNTLNYYIGRLVGVKIFEKEKIIFFKKKHLIRTHEFYVKYGGKTIIIARFMPIIRTFAPFVAGIASMPYWRFQTFNIIGGVSWVLTFMLGGYFFGNIPVVKNNFTLVIFLVIFISLLPGVIGYLSHKFNTSKGESTK